MSAPTELSVTVVGAGVFGVAGALELANRGHVVTLLDAGSVPHPDASSTDISKAVRMDYGADEFYTDLARDAIAGWHEWNRLRGEPLYHEVGILLLSLSSMESGGFEADGHRLLTDRGIPLERLDASRLVERFPAWEGAACRDGYFNPRAGFAESGRAVDWLKQRAVAAGVRLQERTPCAGLHEHRGRVAGVVLEDGRVLESDRVVVAAGAWTPFLLPHLSDFMWATAQPVCHFRPPDGSPFEPGRFPVWCADIANTGRYGFPLTAEGVVKVAHHGPGRRFAPGDELTVTRGEEQSCAEFVAETFRALAGAPIVATRLCLYCDTWDGDFLIDHDPEREGLIVASGGSGHGFKFAPVLGGIIADVLERRPNPAARRFAWRRPGRQRTEQARQGQ